MNRKQVNINESRDTPAQNSSATQSSLSIMKKDIPEDASHPETEDILSFARLICAFGGEVIKEARARARHSSRDIPAQAHACRE
ncbi:unnamed protein product [Plutella xylostella]|uniref:(diamondback moth) hypothetical protein n=1 Tax=Plutella xylostella TaxID=51655 RepID=A0A8S4FN30_PLUXY|nr:unnamed protein product [Plutella xylostella]